MSIQEHFEFFYENIKLTAAQIEDARSKYTGVCKKLHDNYYPDITYDGSTKLLIGSYGKKTHIRPARDVDVIFIMPDDKFEQYDDNQSNGQSQLLQNIKKLLQDKYPNTPITAFGKVVVVEFSDPAHDIELLPAWENEDGTFVIPNSEKGGSWAEWDPRSEILEVQESDSKTARTKALIRMIKKWSENCEVKLKSYEIEHGVIDFLDDQDYSDESYSYLVRDFFAYFHETETDQGVCSHLNTAFNRSKKACEYEESNNLDKAVEEWKKVFGDDFPSSSEKRISVVVPEAKPALADCSHCEALKWSFVGGNSVRIDAYVYNESKAKKLGGINSDGRAISSGLAIKYVAKTNVSGNYQTYWQVVNTGEAASSAQDLRGSLFSDNQTRWEHTRYRGKHWIECFIIQNGYCVARSGKFFINIK